MRTNCLERAGHVLILIIWLEKRLIDLIIFKQHPQILSHFRKHGISIGLAKWRKFYWQKGFHYIIQEFLKTFPNLPSNWEPLLEDLNTKRDMISHGHVSLYREYILYQPDLNRSNLKKKLSIIRRAIDGKITKARLFKIRFDDKNYQSMLQAIEKFDTQLFPQLSTQMNLNYNSIR